MYQNVGSKCRFYIDYLQAWHELGLISHVTYRDEFGMDTNFSGTFYGLDPVVNSRVEVDFTSVPINAVYGIEIHFKNTLSMRMIQSIDFTGLLGHQLSIKNHSLMENWIVAGDTETMVRVRCENGNGETIGYIKPDRSSTTYNIINWDTSQAYGNEAHPGFSKFDVDGFSLSHAVYVGNDENQIKTIVFDIGVYDVTMNSFIPFNINAQCGVLSFGHFYDLRSPDMDLSTTISYDGFTTQESLGGRTFRNARYLGQPDWGVLVPWQMDYNAQGQDNKDVIKNRGRRSWQLKFKYVSDKDMFSSNYGISPWFNENDAPTSESNLESELGDTNNPSRSGEDNFHTNLYDDQQDPSTEYENYWDDNSDINARRWKYLIEDDNSFIAKVMNYVGNGERFIFQPDSESAQQSDFAICTLDQDAIKIRQVSHHVYSISLKIRETW